MNILCIGDVVGNNGCDFLRNRLPAIKKHYNIDFCIVNGENSQEGNGISRASAEHLFSSGADVITGGNHTLRRNEIYEMLEENPFLLRPANYPKSVMGKGMCICDLGYVQIAVINLLGTVYMESMDSPFCVCDELINEAKEKGAKVIVVDFHAEATSEKRAMGFYLDSKITALFGTHTHVQTNDSQILPGGTAYITDIGMTGAKQSVLGIKPEISIGKIKDKLPLRYENAQGESIMSGWIISLDKSYNVVSTETINIE